MREGKNKVLMTYYMEILLIMRIILQKSFGKAISGRETSQDLENTLQKTKFHTKENFEEAI